MGIFLVNDLQRLSIRSDADVDVQGEAMERQIGHAKKW